MHFSGKRTCTSTAGRGWNVCRICLLLAERAMLTKSFAMDQFTAAMFAGPAGLVAAREACGQVLPTQDLMSFFKIQTHIPVVR